MAVRRARTSGRITAPVPATAPRTTQTRATSHATTQDVEVDAVVVALLGFVRTLLEATPADAARRGMLTSLRRLELNVAKWRAVPPSAAQRAAMIGQIEELEEKLRAARDERDC